MIGRAMEGGGLRGPEGPRSPPQPPSPRMKADMLVVYSGAPSTASMALASITTTAASAFVVHRGDPRDDRSGALDRQGFIRNVNDCSPWTGDGEGLAARLEDAAGDAFDSSDASHVTIGAIQRGDRASPRPRPSRAPGPRPSVIRVSGDGATAFTVTP